MDSERQGFFSYSYADVQGAQVGRESEPKQLLRLLAAKDTPQSWQYPIVKALFKKLSDEDIVRGLIRVMNDVEDPKLRDMIINQTLRMSKILREEIADAIAPYRKDANFRTRFTSWTTLWVHVTDNNRERVVPWLIEALSDPYPRTRSDIATRLGQLNAKEAVPELQRLMKEDPSGAVRVSAAFAVFKLTGEAKQAIQLMTVRLRGDTYSGQWESAQLLGEFEELPEITIKALLAKVGPKSKARLIPLRSTRTIDSAAPPSGRSTRSREVVCQLS